MLELLVCSLLTIFPDYLVRRYVQGKRIGREITLFSVWYELRYGIVTCVLLTIGLITAIFYYHPSTTAVVMPFRTVPVLTEGVGRVAEVYVRGSQRVEAGQPLFRLTDETQRTAVETARRAIAEVDASMATARADLAQAEARILEAEGALQQAQDELSTRQELQRRNADIVARREIERLQVTVRTREAGVEAARASRQAVQARISDSLPAQRESATAALAQAQAELDKTVVRAGVTGRVEQFLLQPGDIVNPVLRPAGLLIPEDLGSQRGAVLVAGFNQIEANVLRVGMVAEASCISTPWRVIPLVVTQVQSVLAGGQVQRGTEQILDVQQFRTPGTVLVTLEPLYEGGLRGVVPGSHCFANAYTSNHDVIDNPQTSTGRRIVLHAIDTVGVVHALLLRIQVLLLPIRALVLSGGH